MSRPVLRRLPVCLVPILALVLSGCDLADRYLSGLPGDRLAEAALNQFATRGQPFFDGTSGSDTVASISPTGARAWEVAVLPVSGGVPVVWSLEVIRAEVYATVPGDAFARWLGERARELGVHASLPAEVTDALRRGDLQAVGDLEVRYGLADRTGRNTEERVAYLWREAPGAKAAWRIQPVSRSANVLLGALRTVVDDMVHHDDRVLSCMGDRPPRGIARSVQLACVGKAWAQEFSEERP